MRCSASSYRSGSSLHTKQRREERITPWRSHGAPCLGAAVPTTSRLLTGSDGWPWSFPKQQSLKLCHWGSAAVSRGLAEVEGVVSAQAVSLKRYMVNQSVNLQSQSVTVSQSSKNCIGKRTCNIFI